MSESNKIVEKTSEPDQKPARTEATSLLHWFRESVTAIISLVILAIASLMLYGTYSYVRDGGSATDPNVAASRKESYERQKDIMLYALALLGTVTGYYLGRVPAELHAQQAEKSANNAQDQLQKTQTQLTDTAGSAAAAATQVTVAEKEKDAAKAKLNKAARGLDTVKSVLSRKRAEAKRPARRTLGGQEDGASSESVLGADEEEELRRAEQEIDMILQDIRG